MANQTFERYELKYLLDKKRKDILVGYMKPYMALDEYGRSTIRNIYYDTDTYRLIRHSLDKPVYKEKLRVRSYQQANSDSTVFVELKKKYKSIVYKRRITMLEKQAVEWLRHGGSCPQQTQISREIDYFLHFYETLHPVVFLSYEREAFYSLTGDDFRVTFDENILFREDNLSLQSGIYGNPVLPNNQILMEIKTSGGIPLWMTHFLTKHQVSKVSFSKYGTAYQMILEKAKGGKKYA